MKVIFLDVDGVLLPIDNTDKTIPEDKIILLKDLIQETESKVVLSSTWRINSDRDRDENYENLVKLLNNYEIEIYDHTPIKELKTIKKQIINKSGMTIINYIIDPYSTRGAEINEWLEKNEVESFVILDDQNFYYELFSLKDNFVKIENPYIGLQRVDVEQAKSILNINSKVKTRIK